MKLYPQFNKLNFHSWRLLAMALLCSTFLSGCLISTPFWNQEFASHTDKIPIQGWTIYAGKTVKIECSKAGHGGLYPFGGPEVWSFVANLTPSTSPSYDTVGNITYSLSRYQTLPSACWRKDPANNVWYTAIRATHVLSNGNVANFAVFDKPGLVCMGEENALSGTWFGWLSAGCAKTYSGSSTNIPYVIIYSKT